MKILYNIKSVEERAPDVAKLQVGDKLLCIKDLPGYLYPEPIARIGKEYYVSEIGYRNYNRQLTPFVSIKGSSYISIYPEQAKHFIKI